MATSATTRAEATLTSVEITAKTAAPSLFADYATLFKPRVSLMVLITAAGGFYLGSLGSGISPFNIGALQALAGIAIVTISASFGCAQIEDPATDWGHLLIECDKLLYAAKKLQTLDKTTRQKEVDSFRGQPT